LGWLGIALDAASNTAATGDAVIGAAGSPVGVVVVSAREDLQMAAETRALLNR
jgi:acetate kinase